MTYYIYKHGQGMWYTAKVHHGDCSYCKQGRGVQSGTSNSYYSSWYSNTNGWQGEWIGPYDTVQEAIDDARDMGDVIEIKPCLHCYPYAPERYST